MSKQARISADKYSPKYFAQRVLDVYNLALTGRNTNKSFFGRLKNVVRKSFHDK